MSLILFAHAIAGTLSSFAALVALTVAKGARVHRASGTLFVVLMLIMATPAGNLARHPLGPIESCACMPITGWDARAR